MSTLSLQCRASVEARSKKFEGVAYSGGVISTPFWGPIVIDLSTTQAETPMMAMLIEHDRGQRAGVREVITLSGELRVSAVLENEYGQAVALESQRGFPWQMSVHVEPGYTDELPEPAIVNGRSIAVGTMVFRNSVIREISFTPTGMDSNTWARSLVASQENYLLTDLEAKYGPGNRAAVQAAEANKDYFLADALRGGAGNV